MGMKVEITSLDPASMKYTAVGVVTDEVGEHRYFIEGTWHPGDAAMAAGAIYDQHKAALAARAKIDKAKGEIVTAIEIEVAKLEIDAALEAK